jgi:hypothetical protein
MTSQILTIVTSTSTIIGLLSLLAYLFYSYRIREIEKSERSIKEAAEGEGLFNADQILQIIREFKDDTVRLNAIKQFANIQNKSGERIYNKIKGNIDIARLRTADQRTFKNGSLTLALVFITLALIALLSSLSPFPPFQPSAPAASHFQIGSFVRVFDFSDWNFNEPDSKTVLADKISLKRLDAQATHFELRRELLSERLDRPPQFFSPTRPIIIVAPDRADSSHKRIYRLIFDLSNEPLNECIDLQLKSIYWNEFEMFLGESITQKIEYPTDRLQFEFKSTKWTFTRIERSIGSPGEIFAAGHPLDNSNDPSFVLAPDSKSFTWTIEHPRTNWSYNLLWWLGHIMFVREPTHK